MGQKSGVRKAGVCRQAYAALLSRRIGTGRAPLYPLTVPREARAGGMNRHTTVRLRAAQPYEPLTDGGASAPHHYGNHVAAEDDDDDEERAMRGRAGASFPRARVAPCGGCCVDAVVLTLILAALALSAALLVYLAVASDDEPSTFRLLAYPTPRPGSAAEANSTLASGAPLARCLLSVRWNERVVDYQCLFPDGPTGILGAGLTSACLHGPTLPPSAATADCLLPLCGTALGGSAPPCDLTDKPGSVSGTSGTVTGGSGATGNELARDLLYRPHQYYVRMNTALDPGGAASAFIQSAA